MSSYESQREALLTALEELHVAEEELRQQNDELRASQKKLNHERQKYMALFELSAVGHVLTTLSGEVLEANLAFLTLVNYSKLFYPTNHCKKSS